MHNINKNFFLRHGIIYNGGNLGRHMRRKIIYYGKGEGERKKYICIALANRSIRFGRRYDQSDIVTYTYCKCLQTHV